MEFTRLFDIHDISIAALLFGMIRTFAFCSLFVAFRWAHCNKGIVRGGVTIALGLPVAAGISFSDVLLPSTDQPFLWAGLFLKEVAIGAALGIFLSIPFWTAMAAGAALSIIRFETADAGEDVGATPLERMMLLLMIGAFAFTDAPERMVKIIYFTYEAWPVESYLPNSSNVGLGDFVAILRDALMFALSIFIPFLAAALMFELMIAFSGRFSRYVNYQESLLVRSLTIICALTFVSTILLGVFMAYLGEFNDAVSILVLSVIR